MRVACMSLLLAAACSMLALQVEAKAFSFVTIGDWGGSSIDAKHKANQLDVASAMASAAASLDAQFVINTGDNFYYYGVQNTSDPQFQTDFEDVYKQPSLAVPWYGVLGNHDYAYNVTAQLAYKSPVNNRWVLPERYYTRRIALSDSQYVTFVFLDTSPCQKEFRSSDPAGWDPCNPSWTPPPPPNCDFHQHVIEQSCTKQYEWLNKTLSIVPADDWLIGVGHAPAYEIDVEDLTSLLQKHKMDLYLNGHTHTLEQYSVGESTAFVTSGAGAMVYTPDQEHPPAEAHEGVTSGFKQTVGGFTTHTFSEDLKTLTTTFMDYKGNVLHTFDVQRGVAPSPPPPPPPPSPPSSGSCEKYGCGSFDRSHPCQCNTRCAEYHDCCPDYDKRCKK